MTVRTALQTPLFCSAGRWRHPGAGIRMGVALAEFTKQLIVETINVDLRCACFLHLREMLLEGFIGTKSGLLVGQGLRLARRAKAIKLSVPGGVNVSN